MQKLLQSQHKQLHTGKSCQVAMACNYNEIFSFHFMFGFHRLQVPNIPVNS